ncbi:MAG: ABC transporter substrate-binding protein, partial [Chloroflexota bacterium]
MPNRLSTAMPGAMLLISIILAACSPPLASTPTAAPTTLPKPAAAASPGGSAGPAASPVSGAGAAASPAAAPKPAAAAVSDAEVEAARREGTVVIYASGEAAQWDPLKEAWNKRFPGIDLQVVAQRGRESREKVIAEQAARRVLADIVSAGPDSTTELDKLGFLDAFQPPELQGVQADFRDPRGILIPRNLNLYGLTVNTRLLPDGQEPKRWSDLVDPRYKGKIAMQDPRGSGGGMTIFTALLKVHGEPYLQKLSEQQIFMGAQTADLRNALIRGEYAILLTDTAENVSRSVESGAPIKFIRPEEGVAVTPISVTVVKNAPHPNAAKLFANWILSEEGQTAVASSGSTPVRTGIRAKAPEYGIDGVKILPRDDQESDPDRAAELTKIWERIF